MCGAYAYNDDDDDEEDTIFNKTHSIQIYSQFVVCQTKGEHLNRLRLAVYDWLSITHFLHLSSLLSNVDKSGGDLIKENISKKAK